MTILGRTKLGRQPGLGRTGGASSILSGDAYLFARLAATLTGDAWITFWGLELIGDAYTVLRGILTDTLTGDALIAYAVSQTLAGDGYVAARYTKALTGDGYLKAVFQSLLYGDGLVGARLTKTLPGDGYVSHTMVSDDLTGDGLVAVRTYKALLGDAITCILVTAYLSGDAEIVDYRYYGCGLEGSIIDLSAKVYDPKINGFKIKTTEQRMRNIRQINLIDDGIEGGQIEFDVRFKTESEKQAFDSVVNNDASNLQFYRNASDRFFRVAKVAATPGQRQPSKRIYMSHVNLLMEDPAMYFYRDMGEPLSLSALPKTSKSFTNQGTAPAPILFKIGGYYSGGQTVSIYVKQMDGATEEKSLYVAAQLLSNEYAELTIDGALKAYLMHTYTDDYSTITTWQHDAIQSGCTISGGQVSIPAGAWYSYKFQGSPTKDPIQLSATITLGAGLPVIQQSTDGTTWTTAITTAEMKSGILATYGLTGTEKTSVCYVRFYSPVGASLTVQDVSFSMVRDISGQSSQIPSVLPGLTRTLKVTGSGSANARMQTGFRPRWLP